jgi:uncharacterized protein YgiM (DUF1202 family)
MKKTLIRVLSAVLCLAVFIPCLSFSTSAEKISYVSAANGVSDAYKNSRYYKNLTSIELTGDGVTDVLAVALSQVEYVEGTSSSGFSGTQGGGGNYTEFCRNYGEGSAYAWCAAYVSFCLLQSRATTSTTKHTIWRDIYCPRWYQNLKNEGYGHDAGSNYTPKSGDLVFFTGSGHIGIVRYYKDGKVYTIEGNTSNSAGLNPEGGGVYCKSYDRGYSKFDGFGTPPYKTNPKAFKVDYTGEKPTTGLWISDTAKNLYNDTKLSGTNFTEIPKGTVFEVTKLLSKTGYEVNYNGKKGYIKAQGGSPIYQLTSNAAYKTVPDKIVPDVVVNKYAIDPALKKVKEHIGSGIGKYTLDGAKISTSDVYALNAGQKLGIEGFAGFSTYIKDFGYYFDGNAEGAVWGFEPNEPNEDAKKKAGEKVKLFNIAADTSTLTKGAHTVTFTVKFLNNKTCDLITLNLDVGGTGAVIGGGSELSTESGDVTELGCNSAIGAAVSLPIIVLAGAVIFKKKKED